MKRTYELHFDAITIANAALHLFFINPGVNRALEIVRVRFDQAANATSVIKTVQFVTKVSAFPTLTAATPTPLSLGGPASQITAGTAGAVGTAGVNSSAEGAGARTVLRTYTFNEGVGFEWIATDDKIILPPSHTSGFGVYLPAPLTTLTLWNGTLVFNELGQ